MRKDKRDFKTEFFAWALQVRSFTSREASEALGVSISYASNRIGDYLRSGRLCLSGSLPRSKGYPASYALSPSGIKYARHISK